MTPTPALAHIPTAKIPHQDLLAPAIRTLPNFMDLTV